VFVVEEFTNVEFLPPVLCLGKKFFLWKNQRYRRTRISTHSCARIVVERKRGRRAGLALHWDGHRMVIKSAMYCQIALSSNGLVWVHLGN
jgi:hypothetical protein